MEPRLGDMLVREKMITAGQLAEALGSQADFGVRLGSSLAALGYLGEEPLARFLSRKLGAPCVGSRELAAVPQEIIRDFSRDMVARYNVLPFSLERNRLGLAMCDPTDFRAIEEIAFITGHVVQPYVAADLEISRAQARYYRLVSGETRYRRLAASCSGNGSAGAGEPQVLKEITADDLEGVAARHGAIAPDTCLLPEASEKHAAERLCSDFAAASSRDDVADGLIRYLGQVFGNGALFIVRGNIAEGWRGVARGERIAGFEDMSLSLAKPSVLRDVVESGNFVLGTPLKTRIDRQILKILALADDAALFVLPVSLRKRTLALLLVADDTDDLADRLAGLQKLVGKASLVFEMLIIRNKILMG